MQFAEYDWQAKERNMAEQTHVIGRPTWAEHEAARLAGKLTDPCGLACPRIGTCDQCAEGDKPVYFVDISDPNSAYICEDCLAFHERALDAAVAAVKAHLPDSIVSDEEYRDILVTGIEAYWEYGAAQVAGSDEGPEALGGDADVRN